MNKQLLDQILSSPRLPSLPAVAAAVIEQCRQPDVKITDIADTISNDPALVAKILKTVNSSFYGLRQRVGTIAHAMVILGLYNVKTLALSFSLVSNMRRAGQHVLDMDLLWKRSLYSAVAARAIAQRAGQSDHEDILLGALLQDLGVIAMVQTQSARYVPILTAAQNDMGSLASLERAELDLDHTDVGAAIAESFRLPENLVCAIRHHEQPDSAPAHFLPTARAVCLGAAAADCLLRHDSDSARNTFLSRAADWFGLNRDHCKDLLDQITHDTRELAKFFEIEARPLPNPLELMADAQDLLAQQNLRANQDLISLEQDNHNLKQRANSLERKAETDPLTGIANRGRFDEVLALRFEHAHRQSQPLGLIMIDADRFKTVNDTYGHQAGDKVLIALARLLQNNSPAGSLVARYGGEEFAVVLPDHDRKHATAVAESLRAAIQNAPIDIDTPSPLSVTASMGVAVFDGLRFFQSPEQLIHAADQGVYAAKAAGRNKVRVFVPRESAPQSV